MVDAGGAGLALAVRRRFAGIWAFRLWVEDCPALGGSRVHAMNEVTGARACVEVADATLSEMLASFAALKGSNSTYNVDEFLIVLLDNLHIMSSDDGLSADLSLPVELPQAQTLQPTNDAVERRQAWNENQAAELTLKPAKHHCDETVASRVGIGSGKGKGIRVVEKRSVPEPVTVEVEPQETESTLDATEQLVPPAKPVAANNSKAVAPSRPCPRTPSRPPGKPQGRPLGRAGRPTCRPGAVGVTASHSTFAQRTRPHSAPHGVRRQQNASAREHEQPACETGSTDGAADLKRRPTCDQLTQTDKSIPSRPMDEAQVDVQWSPAAASRTWPESSDRPRRNRPLSAKALKHRRVLDDGIDSIIYEDIYEDEEDVPESSGGQALEADAQAPPSSTGGCEFCPRPSSRTRSGSRSRPASAARAGRRTTSPRPTASWSAVPRREASARRPRSARDVVHSKGDSEPSAELDVTDGQLVDEVAGCASLVQPKRLSWSSSASRIRREEDGYISSERCEDECGTAHCLTLGGGPRESSPPRRHVIRTD